MSGEDMVLAWVEYHLGRARAMRLRLERMVRGSPEYGEVNYVRHLSLEFAKAHLSKLSSLAFPIPAAVLDQVAAEALQ